MLSSFYKHIHGLGCHFHLASLSSELWQTGLAMASPAWECKASSQRSWEPGWLGDYIRREKPQRGSRLQLLLPQMASSPPSWPRSCKNQNYNVTQENKYSGCTDKR